MEVTTPSRNPSRYKHNTHSAADTVVSCFPSTWQSWSNAAEAINKGDPATEATALSQPVRNPDPAPGQRPDSEQQGPSNARTYMSPLKDDPLQQSLLNYLRDTRRPPIMSSYSLACLITTFCATVFDDRRLPEEFQFFDFFSHSIGIIVSEINTLTVSKDLDLTLV